MDVVVIPSVAVIVVVPTVMALATPELLIVATAVFEELQLISVVISFVLRSEETPVALYRCVVPFAMVGFVGVISMDCNDTFVTLVLTPLPPQAARKIDAKKNIANIF